MHQQKRGRGMQGKFVHSPIFLAFLVILALFLLKAVWDLFEKSQDARIAAESVQREYEELVVREAALKESLARLESPDGVESEIRQKFGVVKEGEEVVIVLPEDPTNAKQGMEKEEGWWQKFLSFFQ